MALSRLSRRPQLEALGERLCPSAVHDVALPAPVSHVKIFNGGTYAHVKVFDGITGAELRSFDAADLDLTDADQGSADPTSIAMGGYIRIKKLHSGG